MYWRNSRLVGSAVAWIGKVSYRAYFVHFAVLHFFPALYFMGSSSVDAAVMYAAAVIVTVRARDLGPFDEPDVQNYMGLLAPMYWSYDRYEKTTRSGVFGRPCAHLRDLVPDGVQAG